MKRGSDHYNYNSGSSSNSRSGSNTQSGSRHVQSGVYTGYYSSTTPTSTKDHKRKKNDDDDDYMKRYLEHEDSQRNKQQQKKTSESLLIGTLIGDSSSSSSSNTTSSTSSKDKYLPIYKQEVTDERGRKRFHGAFTGGFSAGYFNTVGSKEGWTPSTFKSSKNERSTFKQYTSTDFMDEEDKRELASRELKTNDLFGGTASFMGSANLGGEDHSNINSSVSEDHSRILFDGVFKDIIQPNSDPIGLRLLKKMGWKEGQTRVVKKHYQKKKPAKRIVIVDNDDNRSIGYQQHSNIAESIKDDEEEEEEVEEDILSSIEYGKEYAKPKEYLPKNDLYGVGYVPSTEILQMKQNIASIVQPTQLLNRGSSKQKTSSSTSSNRLTFGGMGYDDEEDEDNVYSGDNLSRYDQTLGKYGGIKTNIPKGDTRGGLSSNNVEFLMPKDTSARLRKCSDGSAPLPGFVVSLQTTLSSKWFKPPTLPANFDYKHRYSAPLDPSITNRTLQLVSSNITPDKRSVILDEVVLKRDQPSKNQQQQQSLIKPLADPNLIQHVDSIQKAFANRFVSAEEGLNIAKAKELPESKKAKPIRLVLDWHPQPLVCKRFGLMPDKNIDGPQNEKIQRSHLASDLTSQLLSEMDMDQQFTSSSANATKITSNLGEDTFIKAERPPMDLFKAIFENNDQPTATTQQHSTTTTLDDQEEEYDPFNFTETTPSTTSTIVPNTISTPIHKIEENISKQQSQQPHITNEDEEYDPFKEFRDGDNTSTEILATTNQQSIVNIHNPTPSTTTTTTHVNNHSVVDVVDDDEEEYDPFSAFVKQNQSSKSVISKTSVPTIPFKSTVQQQPPPTVEPPQPQPQPQPTYYKVIETNPIPLPLPPPKQKDQQSQRMFIDVDDTPSGKHEKKKEKKREKEQQWVESIKNYLSNFSDSDSSGSSDSDSDSNISDSDSSSDDKRKRKENKRLKRKEKKREKKERRKEKKERKKEKKERKYEKQRDGTRRKLIYTEENK